MIKNRYESVAQSEPTAELEKLLSLAEELHEKCDWRNRAIDRYRLFQLSLLVIGVLIAAWGITRSYFTQAWFESGPSYRDIVFLFEFAVVAYALTFEYLIRRAKYRVMPDVVALSELVELIRETESIIAESEHWSTLERAQFRIRLSRFGIGPQIRGANGAQGESFAKAKKRPSHYKFKR